MEHGMGVYDTKDLIFAETCKTFGSEIFVQQGVAKAVVVAFTGRKPNVEGVTATAVAFPADQAAIVTDGITAAAREVLNR